MLLTQQHKLASMSVLRSGHIASLFLIASVGLNVASLMPKMYW